MSNLSWLNPTPHAIAVYASQPPSPVTTQHSLPSGRYSLLGPDLHRLDCTSFFWPGGAVGSGSGLVKAAGSQSFPSGGGYVCAGLPARPVWLEILSASTNLDIDPAFAS